MGSIVEVRTKTFKTMTKKGTSVHMTVCIQCRQRSSCQHVKWRLCCCKHVHITAQQLARSVIWHGRRAEFHAQVCQTTKPTKGSARNWCDLVASQVPAQVLILDIILLKRQCIVTYNQARRPSPVNAPLAIDVIWLSDRSLQCKQSD